MRPLDGRRAVIIAALMAAVVFANSLRNGWAGDDPLIVRDNVRAHSIHGGLAAWFLPYWPPPWQGAGLYRPLTILTYGVEWTLAGGAPARGHTLWIFHLTNLLLHALATALAVRIALAWLPPAGALAAGLLFAVHPVHVEAVSNVVGRSELLTAVFLFGAVLAARRYRHAARAGEARGPLILVASLVALALFSKEHGVIAIAVIALDHFLDPEAAERRSLPLYLAVVAVTLAWFQVWHSIVGIYVAGGATTAFYGLSPFERLATMMPVQFDVIRLLAWPFDLASDYSQQTVAIHTRWSWAATGGLVLMLAVLALGLALARRASAVAFGILLALGSYAPTSNLLFVSGVVLAERNLFVGVLAPALVLGWVVVAVQGREYQRLALMAITVLIAVFAIRSWSRTPFWRTPQTEIIEEAGDHPENYRSRIHLGDLFAAKRDTARALAEYLAAEALAERDPFTELSIVNSAVALRHFNQAIDHARRASLMAPADARPARWLVQAQLAAGRADSAVTTALAAARANPGSFDHSETYREALSQAGRPRPERLLAGSVAEWNSGRLVQAAAQLDSLEALAKASPSSAPSCDQADYVRPVVLILRPELSKWVESCAKSLSVKE